MLEADESSSLNNPAVNQLAREIFGAAAGFSRAAYDAVEAGFNLYLAKVGFRFPTIEETCRWLKTEDERLPRQNRRDYQQVELQQFSSPHAEAFLVVWAAALRQGMCILEPSAGTGNIAVLARLAGAKVDTNEIDPRRRDLLRLQGFEPTEVDAERLNNLLAPDKTYDAIVMNPPFSATGGRVRGHDGMFGARHVEQALLRLKAGGRLVAIVGAELSCDRPKAVKFWGRIQDNYRVRANLGIDGREYARFGTTYDHQIIVIDHDGPTPSAWSFETGNGLSLGDAIKRLKKLAEEDVYGRICGHNQERSPAAPAATIPANSHAAVRPADRTRGDTTNRAERTRFDGKLFDLQPAVADLERTGSAAAERFDASGEPGSESRATAASSRPVRTSDLGGLAGPERARPDRARLDQNGVGELEQNGTPQIAHIEEGAVYAPYRVQKATVRGALAHPANVVESAAMACVEPPNVTYHHQLPADVIAEGRVSNLQIEDVIYAGQATSAMLPDGSRKGHWNGDGTGIGKGREIYAFTYDQLEQGRTKHVHISASHQLCVDAERDRSAVGVPLPIIHQTEFHPRQTIEADSGVLFTTYTMLATDFGGKQERFKQLVEWLGSDFDGVIAFDEAHLMKNAAATPHGGKATIDHGTQRGNMGIALQRQFPMARVRYFSATGATEARHMAPYERLGLWGAGAPFADFPAFLMAMERGGVAAMEMLCRDLKSVGTYLSRTISYGPTRLPDGSIVPNSAVEYEPLLHRLTENEKRQYDQIADLWSELLVAFEAAEQTAGQGRSGHRYSQFYSAQQRFFLQLMLAYSLPDVLPAIEADLAHGRSVVLSLFNTGEAIADRKVNSARAAGVEPSELDATPREMIVQLIEKQFPIFQHQEKTDPKTGTVVRVRIEDAAGNPEINRENQRRQQQLLDKVADLDFPANPLDAIIGRFGVNNVAEISGRSHRFEKGKYVRRKLEGIPRRALNEYETRLFQQGKKRIAVISGAGSTGISVHADIEAKNQQRRAFYAFQLSWSADQQMQAFGRVHRSHQASAPIIRLVLLDLAGQKRLVNAVSKRLAALGALTKGERQSLSSDLFRPEDITDTYGKRALGQFYRQIVMGDHKQLGLGFATLGRMGVLNKEGTAVRDSYETNVEIFLNRIMVLPVEQQNALFEEFYRRYVSQVEGAKRWGAFDFGVEEIRAYNLQQMSQPETLFVDPDSGARTLLHELVGEVNVHRLSFNTISVASDVSFHQNKRSSRIYAVTPHHLLDSSVTLTNIKDTYRTLQHHELAEKYDPVDVETARARWDAEYDSTPPTENRTYYLLSGAIFPIYDKVMGASGIHSVKIARAVLADGQALVGLNLTRTDIPGVKQRLGIGSPLVQATSDDIVTLLAGGAIIELDNGWRLLTDRISGDDVIELVLNGVAADRSELAGYGLTEEIIHYKRRWFMTSDDAQHVLSLLLVRRRPVRDLSYVDPDEAKFDDDE